tara:strand:- start:180 stop:821 length:642 start_codon:yes stop_codon:yes gene_type:complete
MEAEKLIFLTVFVFVCIVFVLMRGRKEDALLKSFGLKPSKQYESFRASKTKTKIDMPPSSQLIARIQSYQKPITSMHNRDLLIFTWNTPKVSYGATQRVFSLTSKRGRKFPKFICRPQGLLDKIKNDIDIDYSEYKEFSLNFHLTSQEVTDKEVRKLFDNLSLHEYLLKNKTMGIESNGNKIFYFWYGNRVPAERFPKLITELENLHAQYFDI